MARGNQNINDQQYRTRGRNAAESRETTEDEVLYAAERAAYHYGILKKYVRR